MSGARGEGDAHSSPVGDTQLPEGTTWGDMGSDDEDVSNESGGAAPMEVPDSSGGHTGAGIDLGDGGHQKDHAMPVFEYYRPAGVNRKGDDTHAYKIYKLKASFARVFMYMTMYLFHGLSREGALHVNFFARTIPEFDKVMVEDLSGIPLIKYRKSRIGIYMYANGESFGQKCKIMELDNTENMKNVTDSFYNAFVVAFATWHEKHFSQKEKEDAEKNKTENQSGHYTLKDIWVDVCKAYRGELLGVLGEILGNDPYFQNPSVNVSNCMLDEQEIVFDHSEFQDSQHIFEKHEVFPEQFFPERKENVRPFVNAYWADDYLRMNYYEHARKLSNLTGYLDGAGNPKAPTKRNWLRKRMNVYNGMWFDMRTGAYNEAAMTKPPYIVRENTLHVTFGEAYENKLVLSVWFRRMVAMRHVLTMQSFMFMINKSVGNPMFAEYLPQFQIDFKTNVIDVMTTRLYSMSGGPKFDHEHHRNVCNTCMWEVFNKYWPSLDNKMVKTINDMLETGMTNLTLRMVRENWLLLTQCTFDNIEPNDNVEIDFPIVNIFPKEDNIPAPPSLKQERLKNKQMKSRNRQGAASSPAARASNPPLSLIHI